MTEKIYKLLKDSPAMRWDSLGVISLGDVLCLHVRRHLNHL